MCRHFSSRLISTLEAAMLEESTGPFRTIPEGTLRQVRGGATETATDDATPTTSKTRPLTGFYDDGLASGLGGQVRPK
jgi:hypothetical protein